MTTKKSQQGISVVFILIFSSIFIIVLTGFIGLVSFRYKDSVKASTRVEAVHIAEAGLNYYRWHLIKNPGDIQDGQAWCCVAPPCASCGPYEHNYYDPLGQKQGKFILNITAKEICGEILGVYVESTGQSDTMPSEERTLKVKLASTSIADFAYILNDEVWAGSDREIFGKYHSNSGVRMDGAHNSLVTSAANSWLCTWCDSGDCPTGCAPSGSDCQCDGVCGEGGPDDLWQFPVPFFDFNGITADLANMKTLAQALGEYYPPSTDLNPSGQGYHLIFNPDGSFDIRIITGLSQRRAYDSQHGYWYWSREVISQEQNYQSNVALDSDCQLVFIEDDIWVQGTVFGRKTVASADLISPTNDTTVIFNGNLDYTTLDGNDSLALIAEQDVLIPLQSPDTMIVRGVFVAQKGWFGRKHYSCSWYPADCFKSDLTIYGSIVSNQRVGTQWVNTAGNPISGYLQRHNYFDAKLAKDPPPLLPYVSNTLEFISWEEVD